MANAPNTISIDQWLGFMEDEYLSTFIKDGGASIKFAVTPNDEAKSYLHRKTIDLCRKLDYAFVELDASLRSMRAYMPQDIFFGLASQVDWRLMARRLMLRLASAQDFRVENIDPAASDNVVDAIADANGLESQIVRMGMRRAIQDNVLKNPNMGKDFRVAMTHLCLNDEPVILDWLTGENTRISNVHPFQIFTPINRTTARYFIESALYWISHAGYAGTVILLDNSRVLIPSRRLIPRNPENKNRYYSRPMTMEHYELLREFIDDADRLSSTLFIVSTNYDFLDESTGRSWHIYDALHTRVMDDVRDRALVNPAASLVRLSK